MTKRRLLTLCILVALCALALPAQRSHAVVEITFWHAMTGNNQNNVTALVKAFNESHADIKVVEQNKGSSYNDELNAVIAASQQKQGPNVAQIFDLGTALAIDSGFFVPAESLLTAEQLKKVKEDVVGPVLGYYTIEGKLYSLPWNNSNPLLYYNKDLFKAAGLDPSKPPATWQEVDEYCAKLMEAKVAPNCIALGTYGWFFEQWMALQGAELANNTNGRAGRATETYLTSEAAKNIMTWWKSLFDKKYAIETGKLEDTVGARQIFASKQAAMVIDSTGSLGGLTKNAADAGFELGTGFLPHNAKIERAGPIVGGASLWFGAGHSDEANKAAVTFVLWLHEAEQMAKWHQGTGYLPITKGAQKVLEASDYFQKNPGQRTAVDQLNAGKQNSATAGAIMGPFPQIRTIVDQAIQNVITGGSSVDDALKEAKSKADAALADYNSRLKK